MDQEESSLNDEPKHTKQRSLSFLGTNYRQKRISKRSTRPTSSSKASTIGNIKPEFNMNKIIQWGVYDNFKTFIVQQDSIDELLAYIDFNNFVSVYHQDNLQNYATSLINKWINTKFVLPIIQSYISQNPLPEVFNEKMFNGLCTTLYIYIQPLYEKWISSGNITRSESKFILQPSISAIDIETVKKQTIPKSFSGLILLEFPQLVTPFSRFLDILPHGKDLLTLYIKIHNFKQSILFDDELKQHATEIQTLWEKCKEHFSSLTEKPDNILSRRMYNNLLSQLENILSTYYHQLLLIYSEIHSCEISFNFV